MRSLKLTLGGQMVLVYKKITCYKRRNALPTKTLVTRTETIEIDVS